MQITDRGLALNSKILAAGGPLVFTRVAASTGSDDGQPAENATSMSSEDFPSLVGMTWGPGSRDTELKIEAYLDNANIATAVEITEIGLFATDPDLGEILYAIDKMHDNPVVIPAFEQLSVSAVPCRVIFEIRVEMLRGLQVTVEFAVNNYLTITEADGRYWIIGKKYPATEITESIGTTVEAHQRWQDERLQIIQQTLDSGTTNATTVEIGATRPLLWQIMNYNGYYDAAAVAYRAGGKIPDALVIAPPVDDTGQIVPPDSTTGSGGKRPGKR